MRHVLALALVGSFSASSAAQEVVPLAASFFAHDHAWSSTRGDAHAPIGVMGDHTHEVGEWMVSVRMMSMSMRGLRIGTDGVSPQGVIGSGFAVTPTSMDTDVIMLGGMYAPAQDWTLTAMIPYVQNTMDHLTASNARFETESSGIGDLRLGALYEVESTSEVRGHLNFALSIPTGSIDERDVTPASSPASTRLPYPMQLGSGTFDVMAGATAIVQKPDYSIGAQALGTYRLGENDRDYTLGNRLEATVWGSYPIRDRQSISLRLRGSRWSNIDGADPDLNPAQVPTADPNLQGGTRVDVSLGYNFASEGRHRVAVEASVPVYQDLEGPQLEMDSMVTIGWQFAWGGQH